MTNYDKNNLGNPENLRKIKVQTKRKSKLINSIINLILK